MECHFPFQPIDEVSFILQRAFHLKKTLNKPNHDLSKDASQTGLIKLEFNPHKSSF